MEKYKVLIILIGFIILFLVSSCEKDPGQYKPDPVLSDYEIRIRKKFDDYAMFTWSDYNRFTETLLNPRYIVLPLNEMRNTFDPSKIIIGLRHDVDLNPFKAVEMARIENSYGIRSTFFFLATAEYFGSINNKILAREPAMESLLREVHNTGSEIGIHNDLLAVMINYKADPLLFCREEISYYRSLRIRIHGTASHGSMIAKSTVPNYNIFSDFDTAAYVEYGGDRYPVGIYSLEEFGFEYEAYKIPFNKYFSDSGGRWNDPEGMQGVIKKIESSQPGDRIEILVHPDWWGKQ
ncbi:MAG TPA: hypothetical protein VK155_17590 [Bacteroidales bacterium]|nr:hypothetical protein [Bacteroidales bacterium]